MPLCLISKKFIHCIKTFGKCRFFSSATLHGVQDYDSQFTESAQFNELNLKSLFGKVEFLKLYFEMLHLLLQKSMTFSSRISQKDKL